MNFQATRQPVHNRGVPPAAFLCALVAWGRVAPLETYAPNSNPADVFALVKGALGPWRDLQHRRAVLLEVMRVHAGFESGWNWQEGVDRTNQTSMTHIEGQETGIFQVSFDSTRLDGGALQPYAREHGIEIPQKFIAGMKEDPQLALDYYAHLVRISVQWAGPLKRREIHPWLRREAVAEFESLLAPVPAPAPVA